MKVPLVILEERMLHDLFNAVAAQPAVAVGKEAADEVLRPGGHLHVLRELERVLMVHNFAVCAHQRLGVEGRVAHQHLVEEDTHAPPVALAAILSGAALGFKHLRGYVVGSADGRLGADHAVGAHLHAGAKVS